MGVAVVRDNYLYVGWIGGESEIEPKESISCPVLTCKLTLAKSKLEEIGLDVQRWRNSSIMKGASG